MEISSLNLSSFSEKSRAAEQSFSLQYTSLILIVLCFILGSFVSAKFRNQQSLGPEPTPPSGMMVYSDLFTTGESVADSDRVQAVAEFMENHDVRAEIAIPLTDGEGSEAQLSLALARSVSIFRTLVKAGVPADSLQVEAGQGDPQHQIEIKFFREEL